MASRKEQKEQARQERLAKEQELTARKQRARRMQLFGGAIAVAIAVIVVAIVVSSGGNKPKPTGIQTGTTQTSIYNTVDKMLAGIPQHGSVLGNPNAKITLTYFGDLECPICRDFTLAEFPQFVQNFVRPGKVKVDYKSSCTATCNNPTWGSQNAAYQHFGLQQVAALAAGKQNKFWYYTELFYHQQGAEGTGYVTNAFLGSIARQIPGLDVKQWSKDLTDSSLLARVSADEKLSQKEAPNGTPTLILNGPKGALPVQGTCTIPGGSSPEGFPCYPALAAAVKSVS